MASTPRRTGGGLFEGLYRVIMRRNSIYITFVIAGAFLGERVGQPYIRVSSLNQFC
ncbi:putative cytochrome b-c1 complex subunit 9 [Rosa chinensis]|uniref:Complex III subunit 9 n=1 Tax=Rosa chinensis TaxID=74649 RepID=A0A2P6PI23_ROSCH|nr:putative cytochrome b-c1 complex subunit 9 [Rosa chinensis]